MSKPLVSVCIPVNHAWEAIELCIESIIDRTSEPSYQIIVNDQSGGKGEGNRLEYLRRHADDGNIMLIEDDTYVRSDVQNHGKAIQNMMKHVDTQYAMLFESDLEVIKSDWLSCLISKMEGDREPQTVLGVSPFCGGRNHWDLRWIAPRYVPAWMMLDVPAYRTIESDDDWDCSEIPFDAWPYPRVFEGLTPPRKPENGVMKVFRDTGWRLWETLTFHNPGGLRILPMPTGYVGLRVRHYGGIDRNSYKGEDDCHIISRRMAIQEQLNILRGRKKA